jgi:hypothetical protein
VCCPGDHPVRPGGMRERPNRHAWKACVGPAHRGFESHSLRPGVSHCPGRARPSGTVALTWRSCGQGSTLEVTARGRCHQRCCHTVSCGARLIHRADGNEERNAKVTGLCSRRSGEQEHSSVSRWLAMCGSSGIPNPTNPMRCQLILDEGSVASPAHAVADRHLGGMRHVDVCARSGTPAPVVTAPSSRSVRPAALLNNVLLAEQAELGGAFGCFVP